MRSFTQYLSNSAELTALFLIYLGQDNWPEDVSQIIDYLIAGERTEALNFLFLTPVQLNVDVHLN